MPKIEISHCYKNDIHNDDSYFIQDLGFSFFIGISDGVSSNKLGKVCSFLTLDKIQFNINNKLFIENLKKDMEEGKDLKMVLKSLVEISFRDIMDDYKEKRIPKHFKEMIKKDSDDPKATVLIGLIDLVNMMLYTYSLGDSECWIIRNGCLYSHCGFSINSDHVLVSYFSLLTGINGFADISSRKIYIGDIIVFNTDGAKVTWTSKFGIPGIPFLRHLSQDFANSAYKWISFLETNKVLADDATLVILKIV